MSYIELIEKNYTDAVRGIKEEWLNSINNNWFNHVIELQRNPQITYLIVVFERQVFNGGFHQYFVNGYGQFANETIKALIEIGALRKAELLTSALKLVKLKNISNEIFREKLLNKEIDFLFETDELFKPMEKINNDYYSIDDEDLFRMLENYLQNR